MKALLTAVIACLCLGLQTPADDPWFIDDEQFSKDFSERLSDLAKKKQCLRPSELKAKLQPKSCKLEVPTPPKQVMTPEAVFQRALASVFVVGSVQRSEQEGKKWDDGRQATAWALTADGVLVTNWHVFESAGKERFGVANAKGEVFPIIDILAGNVEADIAVIRVKGKNIQPLPLGGDEPVASWVGVLGHPGGQLFTFTQGFVTRFSREHGEGKKPAQWMSITADYAQGSSGAPVLNKFGEVVGMAAMTQTLESDEGDDPAAPPKTRRRRFQEPPPKPEEKKEDQPEAHVRPAPQVQMVTKLAVPARVIRQLISGE